MSWLKLHREITAWEWYSDADTFRVFLHLLMTVQYATGEAWVTLDALAEALRMQKHRVSQAIANLQRTGEIQKTASKTGKNGGMLLRVVNWAKYQMVGIDTVVSIPAPLPPEPAPHPAPALPFPTPKDPAEVLTAARAAGLLFTPEMAQDFFDYYNAIGWTTNAGQIRNWRYKLRKWMSGKAREITNPAAQINRTKKGI